MTKGMFAVFADDDEETTTQQQTTKAAPKKAAPAQAKPAQPKEERPATAKPQRAPQQIDGAGFDGVTGQETSGRGGRGGRGGFRGGRGGRGERREGEEGVARGEFRGSRGGRGGPRGGERRPRPEGAEGGEVREFRPRQEGEREFRPRAEGEREYRPRTEGGEFRGRGRGGPRPPRAAAAEGQVEGDEGVVIAQRKPKVDFEGRTHAYEGKRREPYHPYDRKDGTGRGRGLPKGGHGKGNWGTATDEVKVAETAGAEGEVKPTEEGAETEKVEDAVVEATPVEEVVEEVKEPTEDDKHAAKLTLQEYLAQKKKSTLKKEKRGHEENKKGNLEAAAQKTEKTVSLQSQLRDQEVYNIAVGKTETSNLLSFQGEEDDFYVSERRTGGGARGGSNYRGGRGGRGGASRPEGGHPRGGARQQQLRVDENSFPSLA